MTSFSPCHDHYKRMLQLHEKLRKCEKERMELERKFNLMKQESQLKHEASKNKLRMRYIEFLEEQRERDQRNYELLKALDRVDKSLESMTAKAAKLHTLRNEYDTFVTRAHVNRRQTGSVAVDSGIISQNDEGASKRGLHASTDYVPGLQTNLQQMVYTSPTSLNIPHSLDQIIRNPSRLPDHASSLLHIPKSTEHCNDLLSQCRQPSVENYRRETTLQETPHGFGNSTWTRGFTSNDFDLALKSNMCRNIVKEGLSSTQSKCIARELNEPKSSSVLGKLLNSKEERVGCVLEHELDRYIHRIRSLHDNSNLHSLEEIEQNTTGDLLNVSMSEDSLHHSSVGEQIQDQELAIGMSKILSIADDLVFKIGNVGDNANDVEPHQVTDEIDQVAGIEREPLSRTGTDSSVAMMNLSPTKSDTQSVTSTMASAIVEEDASGNNFTIHTTKSKQPTMNIRAVTMPASEDVVSHVQSAHRGRADIKFANEDVTTVNINDSVEAVSANELHKESPIISDRDNDVIHSVKRNMEDPTIERIYANETANSIDSLSHHRPDVPTQVAENNNFVETKQAEVNKEDIVDAVGNVSTQQSNNNPESENNMDGGQPIDGHYKELEQNDASPHDQQFVQPYPQDSQDYPQDPNQMYEYNNEQYQHDPNQQYQYNPDLQYEQTANGEYQYDQQNLQYMEDPNAQYQNQMYIDDGNQQYVMNPGEQYQEYSNDPNNQYDPAACIQDPNVTYDPNTIYTYPVDENYMKDDEYGESQDYVPDQHHQEYQEELDHHENLQDHNGEAATDHQTEETTNEVIHDVGSEEQHNLDVSGKDVALMEQHTTKESIDAVGNVLDSETDSIIEKNISNTESDFDFN